MHANSKAYKGIAMEGFIARWYASGTAGGRDDLRALARRITGELEPGAAILEVAPGPGYLAIELAKAGDFEVAAVDISETFVAIARANAKKEAVAIDFRHGDAAALPFADDSFERVVCRAAFKNFSNPVSAAREMRRVLRPGGKAMIMDMRRDAPRSAIAAEVKRLHLGAIDSLLTKWSLLALKRRAYTRDQICGIVSEAGFRSWRIEEEGIGFEFAAEE
jgi:ubiquinone/menaquinone biosynthesis C-methylase UbiE